MPSLQLSQQQLLNVIAVWLSEGSGWIIVSIDDYYINTAVYDVLLGSLYIQLPAELQHLNKGLINLINNDNECFRWCHIRYLNPKDNNPQRIISDKLMVDQLNYNGVEFPVSVKYYASIETQNGININVFGYENKEFYPIYVSKQNNEIC